MPVQKKMSLVEYLSDQTLGGGSWADDDIDLSSISVPIEKAPHRSNNYSSPGGGGGYYNNQQSSYQGMGPPYIAKLINLPVTANEAFIQDLFDSRYTKISKFKILFDPSTNVLTSKIIKKISFVELLSSSDLSKVLKWHDLFYNTNKKITPELANFDDFKNSVQFNEKHAKALHDIETEYLANMHPGLGNRQRQSPQSNTILTHSNPIPLHVQNQNTVAHQQTSQQRKKSNPFGNAKPVDVLSKQMELEKKLNSLAINHTTFRTLGDGAEPTSKNDVPTGNSFTSNLVSPKAAPAVFIPASIYPIGDGSKTKITLADKLSAKVTPIVSTPKSQGTKLASSGKKSPTKLDDLTLKPKPKVILKRKTIDLTVKESDVLKSEEIKKTEPFIDNITHTEVVVVEDATSPQNSVAEAKIATKLKAINDKLAQEKSASFASPPNYPPSQHQQLQQQQQQLYQQLQQYNPQQNGFNQHQIQQHMARQIYSNPHPLPHPPIQQIAQPPNSTTSKIIKNSDHVPPVKNIAHKPPVAKDVQGTANFGLNLKYGQTKPNPRLGNGNGNGNGAVEKMKESNDSERPTRRTDTYIPKAQKDSNGTVRGRPEPKSKFKSQRNTDKEDKNEKLGGSKTKSSIETVSKSNSESTDSIAKTELKPKPTGKSPPKSKTDSNSTKPEVRKAVSPKRSNTAEDVTSKGDTKIAETENAKESIKITESLGEDGASTTPAIRGGRGRGRGRGRGGRGRGRGGYVNLNQHYIRDKSKEEVKPQV